MNFNFRKIASVLASTVMIGSTVGMAAAASFPQPFVAGGRADVAIVTGASAAASDAVAAVNIASKLSESVTRSAATTGGSTTIAGGDFVKLERSSDKFNLGDQADDFYATIDSEELGIVLADGTYLNDENDEFEYEQTITMASMALEHFLDSKFNDEKPIIGFNLDAGDSILNYTLDFTDAAEGGTAFADLENTQFEMLGKEFYISDVVNATGGLTITLLDAANTIMADDGETTTVTVEGKSYEVTPQIYSDTEVVFTVDGETTNDLSDGDTFKLKSGAYIGVKNIRFSDRESTVPSVEFSLGTGKIVLENGQEVEVNEDPISDLEDANEYTYLVNAYITTSSTNVESITLEWKMDDDAWVAPGYDLTMPGFNTIKFSMGGFTVPAEEITTIEDNGDSVSISTELTDGSIDFSILYANSSVTGFSGLGEDSDYKFVSNSSTSPTLSLNVSDETYFAATWINGDDFESAIYQVTSVDNESSKNVVKLDNVAKGTNEVTLSEVGDVEDIGQVRFTLVSANDGDETARVKIAPAGSSGIVYSNFLVTEKGLKMQLPVDNQTGAGAVFITNTTAVSNPTSFVLQFWEEDTNDNIGSGDPFNVTVGLDATDGTEPTATTITTHDEEEDSDIGVGYLASDLATKVRFNNPSDDLADIEIIYPGSESYADVYLSEVSASVTADSNGTTTVSSVMSVKDNEVESVSGKNLVVVGGSCINTVAAKLLGSSTPICGTAFTEKTKVAAGQYLVQTFASPYGTSNKVATLVAGYNADDTTNAATYLTTQVVDTTAGKKYVGTTGTSATLQVA